MERLAVIEKEARAAAKSLIWVKLVGIGSLGAGKTSLIKHYCEGKFSNGYQPTIGVDYGFKVQAITGLEVRVHLWDLSGHEDYVEVRSELYRGTDGVFIVFDLTNQASFEQSGAWLDEATRYCYDGKPTFTLVGTKSDLHLKRAVTAAEAQKWAQSHKMNYAEVSSANGKDVEGMFGDLLFNVLQKHNGTEANAASAEQN